MALKDLLNMTKTDRYTQDGRDKINELQAKVTEDVTYKPGDISQKTGLQKQPDGSWAPPKNAGKNVHGAEVDKIYEKHQKRIKELKAKGYTDEQIENDKIYQQTKEDMRNVGKSKSEESKPAAGNKGKLTWSDNASVSEKVNDIINLGAKSEDKTKGPGYFYGPIYQERFIRKELKKRFNASDESIEDLLDSMDNKAKKNAYNGLMENYYSTESKGKSKSATKGSKKGQVLNTFKTGNADSKWDVNITGGENELANEFFEQHGARFNYHGKDVNLDDYVKPIDNNSFELKVFNAGNQSRGYYGKLVGKGNNTDIRYIVTKTPNGWNIQEKERRYYGLPERQQEYKLDNNKYIKDTPKDSAPRILTGDTKIRIKK